MSSRLPRSLTTWLEAVAGVGLFALILLTTLDTMGRYALDAPVAGALELTELTMVVVVFGSLAIAQREKAHVAVDLLTSRLGSRARIWVELFGTALALLLVLAMAWRSGVHGLELRKTGDETGTLGIAVFPFYFGVALGCLGMAAELVRDVIQALQSHDR
jgi:TRAP-type C4-dicarboxylate transport system permease small subunit